MENEIETEVAVELKYCERCGSLWLRRAAAPHIYCAKCELLMLHMAQPRPHADHTPDWLRRRLVERGVACA
jgi:Zn-finger nucleic acid-binding protein